MCMFNGGMRKQVIEMSGLGRLKKSLKSMKSDKVAVVRK